MVSPTKEARNIYRLGTWNVRTLNNVENEVIWKMQRYNLDILSLSEIKARGNRMKDSMEPSMCTLKRQTEE